MRSLNEYSGIIGAYLNDLSLDVARVPQLYEPIKYALQAGGKRLRPSLTLMGCEAVGGDIQTALSAACGMEVFHNFTLLHDDVMDKSDMRRSRPTVHKKWNENVAILSGDAMLTLATQLVSAVNKDVLSEVLSVFNKAAMDVYEGQAIDMDFEQRSEVSLDEYIEMIRLKTGVLLGASVKVGALIGGASMATADALYTYGEKLGLAFQIDDDYLDVYGDASTFGKPIGGDINNNKKTYPLLYTLSKDGHVSDALQAALKLPEGDVKVKAVRNLYDEADAGGACKKASAHYFGEAIRALKNAEISEEGVSSFIKLAEKLTGRKR
jgi:geranylgeranyl diphosphate synthase, type II